MKKKTQLSTKDLKPTRGGVKTKIKAGIGNIKYED
jgi:hypothetical protein